MQPQNINGVSVPYNLSVDELEKMLSTNDMSEFVVASEALSYKTDEKSFKLLERYIIDKDKYKRLCVLKTIFRHPLAEKVYGFLKETLLCDDILFAENALQAVFENKIEVEDKIIISAVSNHLQKLYSTSLHALYSLNITEENFNILGDLFKQSTVCGQKEVLAEILCKSYLDKNSLELFELFSVDKFSKIRMLAVEIGKKYNYDITKFYDDVDGKVKKEALKKQVNFSGCHSV